MFSHQLYGADFPSRFEVKVLVELVVCTLKCLAVANERRKMTVILEEMKLYKKKKMNLLMKRVQSKRKRKALRA